MMSESVIDRLEVVEVDEHHRHQTTTAPSTIGGMLESLQPQVAICQTREGIVQAANAKQIRLRQGIHACLCVNRWAAATSGKDLGCPQVLRYQRTRRVAVEIKSTQSLLVQTQRKGKNRGQAIGTSPRGELREPRIGRQIGDGHLCRITSFEAATKCNSRKSPLVPPYDGRRESAEIDRGGTHRDGANVPEPSDNGASHPERPTAIEGCSSRQGQGGTEGDTRGWHLACGASTAQAGSVPLAEYAWAGVVRSAGSPAGEQPVQRRCWWWPPLGRRAQSALVRRGGAGNWSARVQGGAFKDLCGPAG